MNKFNDILQKKSLNKLKVKASYIFGTHSEFGPQKRQNFY
jgi:hypothetical protein